MLIGILNFGIHFTLFADLSESRLGEDLLVNPLLDCQDAPGQEIKELFTVKNKIESLIQEKIKQGELLDASVYFRALNDGPWFGIKQDHQYAPASLLKVPIMISIFRYVQDNPELLEERLKYEKKLSDYEQEILPSKTLTLGESYTIDELIQRMIIYSDNEAKHLLTDWIKTQKIVKKDYYLNVPGDLITIRLYSSFFRILYNSSYLNKKMSQKALDYLTKTEFKDGIVASVPPNILVAHKFAERRNKDIILLHDCGIIYYPKHPYILFVMSVGKEIGKLKKNIAEISRIIYEEHSKQFNLKQK